MNRTALLSACLLSSLEGVACDGKNPDDGLPEGAEPFAVDEEGGTFTSKDGLTIEVPPGALSARAQLSIERIEDTRAGALGPMFVLGPEGQTFAKPIKLTLPVTVELEAELADNTFLAAYAYTAPTGSDDFTRLERHDLAPGGLVTETSHFSTFYAGMTPPAPLADLQAYPKAIAVDTDYVYFTSAGTEANSPADLNDGYIFRVKPGAEPEAMTPADPDPTALYVSDSHVYWASGGDDDPVIASAIKRVDKGTLEVETLVEVGYLVSILGDSSSIYFGDGDGDSIYKMPLDGGQPEVIATEAGFPAHLAQDAQNIYWTGGSATNKVYKVAKSGGEVSVIAENEAAPAGIAVDTGFVYWANTGDGGVYKAPIDGGEKTLIYQGGSMVGLAIRGSTLFSTDVSLNRSVQAHDLTNNTTTVLALDQHYVWRIVAPEGQDVFWSNAGDNRFEGQIMSLAAP